MRIEVDINGNVTEHEDAPVTWDIAVYNIPQSITMRQARLALLVHNKLDAVQIAINSLPSPQKEQAQIEWEYASDVKITNPLIVQLMSALGFTEVDLDNLFIEASQL